MTSTITYRGELRCFSCSRYLGEFESHPLAHGPPDLHLLTPQDGPLRQRPVQTERGLRCSVCNGRVIAEYIDREVA